MNFIEGASAVSSRSAPEQGCREVFRLVGPSGCRVDHGPFGDIAV